MLSSIRNNKRVWVIFSCTPVRQHNAVMDWVILSVVFPSYFTDNSFAPHALRTAANIFDDVSSGKTINDAAFYRVPETIKTLHLTILISPAVVTAGNASPTRKT